MRDGIGKERNIIIRHSYFQKSVLFPEMRRSLGLPYPQRYDGKGHYGMQRGESREKPCCTFVRPYLLWKMGGFKGFGFVSGDDGRNEWRGGLGNGRVL